MSKSKILVALTLIVISACSESNNKSPLPSPNQNNPASRTIDYINALIESELSQSSSDKYSNESRFFNNTDGKEYSSSHYKLKVE